jgi:tol-pal system protein YbgF
MTTRTIRLLTLAALLVSLSPAPAAAVDREHQQIEADIRMLQEQAQQLQQMLAGLGDALKQLSSRVDDQTALERKAFADGKVQMDGLTGDVRTVREKVDETNVRLSSLAQELEALLASMPQPGAAAPPPATSDAGQPQGTAPAGGAAPQPAAVAGQTPGRLWESAYGDYSLGQYPLAVQGFEAFIKYYPKSDQADDAQFYIGESYSASAKWSDALTAYARVISDYPGGNQVPNAYYKQGVAFENMRQPDQARQAYQTLVEKFPDSDAAIRARQRLTGLSRPAAR